MRNVPLIVALATPLLLLGAAPFADAQPQNPPPQNNNGQAVPDAPQPQKKPPSKSQTAAPASSDAPAPPADQAPPQQPATKNENPFPESVSRDAAKTASDASANTDSSSKGKSSPIPVAPKNPAATENPFPESVSRDAAKAAGGSSESDSGSDAKATPKSDLPPGVSSSRSEHSIDDEPGGAPKVTDPVLAKKDTSIGSYYLQTGNYQGALLRYKEAMASDPANVDAIFGMAQAQRSLKQNAEAARNYQLYLDIVPNGPKTKQALKALKELGSGK